MAILFIILFTLTFSPRSHAELDCENRPWPPGFKNRVELVAKNIISQIDLSGKSQILGAWYLSPKGDKTRDEKEPIITIFENGTLLIHNQSRKYEIKEDRIIFSPPGLSREPKNQKRFQGRRLPPCLYLLKIGNDLFLPSHEEVIKKLFR